MTSRIHELLISFLISRTFVILGYVFILLILLLSVFFAVGYYTLTAVELVAGTVVFSWIILFIRTADALKRDAEREASNGDTRRKSP